MKKFLVLFFLNISIALNYAYAFNDKDVRLSVKQAGGIEKFLKMLVESQVNNLPQQIDSETKVLAMMASNNTLHITHQMINVVAKEEISNEGIEKFIKFQANKICTSNVGKILLREFDARYRYQYIGNTGNNIMAFTVTKKNCE